MTEQVAFRMGQTGRIVLVRHLPVGDWRGEAVDREIALYKGTRNGAWLHRQKVSHGEQAWTSAHKPEISIFDVDLIAFGFAQGMQEDLRFAREAWEQKDPYWLEPEPT